MAVGLQTNREIDRGNAHEGALASDFGCFGIKFWDEMTGLHARTEPRREHVRWFNMAPNGLAHDDAAKVAKVFRSLCLPRTPRLSRAPVNR